MFEYRVELSEQTNKEVEEIYNYLVAISYDEKYAQVTVRKIVNAMNSLRIFPHAHQDRLKGRFKNVGYKQLLVDSYIVIYSIIEEEKKVYILTVQYYGRNV